MGQEASVPRNPIGGDDTNPPTNNHGRGSNAGGGGNIKVIVNANGFLGQYEMLTTQGRVGVEIEGNEVEDDWKRKGCVPLPSNVLDHKPPETCMNEGMLVLNSTDGDLEFIVDTGS